MRYTKFTLKNFKGIEEVDFDFLLKRKKKPAVLLGLNESGKTTILEGIKLIGKHCRHLAKGNDGSPLSIENGELQAIIPKPQIDEPAFDGKIELSCVLQDLKHQRSFAFVYDIRNSTYERFSVFIGEKDLKSMEEEEKQKAIALAEQVPDILYYDDFTLEIPEKITFITKKGEEFYNDSEEVCPKDNPEWRRILQDVFKSLNKDKKKDRNFEEIYVDFLNTNTSSDAESVLKDAVSTLSKHLDKRITK